MYKRNSAAIIFISKINVSDGIVHSLARVFFFFSGLPGISFKKISAEADGGRWSATGSGQISRTKRIRKPADVRGDSTRERIPRSGLGGLYAHKCNETRGTSSV